MCFLCVCAQRRLAVSFLRMSIPVPCHHRHAHIHTLRILRIVRDHSSAHPHLHTHPFDSRTVIHSFDTRTIIRCACSRPSSSTCVSPVILVLFIVLCVFSPSSCGRAFSSFRYSHYQATCSPSSFAQVSIPRVVHVTVVHVTVSVDILHSIIRDSARACTRSPRPYSCVHPCTRTCAPALIPQTRTLSLIHCACSVYLVQVMSY